MRSHDDVSLELLLDEPEIAAWLNPDDRDDDTDSPEQRTARDSTSSPRKRRPRGGEHSAD